MFYLQQGVSPPLLPPLHELMYDMRPDEATPRVMQNGEQELSEQVRQAGYDAVRHCTAQDVWCRACIDSGTGVHLCLRACALWEESAGAWHDETRHDKARARLYEERWLA